MIQVVRHAETGEMKISADPKGFAALAEAITNPPAAVETEVPDKTWPYDQSLTLIKVENSDSLVLIDHEESVAAMRIVGSQQSREVLAENIIDFVQMEKPGAHWHVEWFPEHFYLAEGGASVVVSLNES